MELNVQIGNLETEKITATSGRRGTITKQIKRLQKEVDALTALGSFP
jgi:hypothetical protein